MRAKRKIMVFIVLVCVGGLLYAMLHLYVNGKHDADRQADASTETFTDRMAEVSEDIDTEDEQGMELSAAESDQDTESGISDKENTTEVSQAAFIQSEYQRIMELPAGNMAVEGMVSDELINRLFFSNAIDDTLLARINGYSYTPNDTVGVNDLSYLRMLYYGSDGNTYVGEMIVNWKIADKVLEIFQKLYENQYPIEKMVLIDTYHAEDEASMSDNNTSAFNYRPIAGSKKLSKHSYGLAIDLNPKYNPYVKTAFDGTTICQPENGRSYIDRSLDFAYKIDENDLAYQLFTEAGFTWGGHWNSLKDYQHFEYDAN